MKSPSGFPQVTQTLDKDKTKEIPCSGSHKVETWTLSCPKLWNVHIKVSIFYILNVIAIEVLQCCSLAKSPWSKGMLLAPGKTFEPRRWACDFSRNRTKTFWCYHEHQRKWVSEWAAKNPHSQTLSIWVLLIENWPCCISKGFASLITPLFERRARGFGGCPSKGLVRLLKSKSQDVKSSEFM